MNHTPQGGSRKDSPLLGFKEDADATNYVQVCTCDHPLSDCGTLVFGVCECCDNPSVHPRPTVTVSRERLGEPDGVPVLGGEPDGSGDAGSAAGGERTVGQSAAVGWKCSGCGMRIDQHPVEMYCGTFTPSITLAVGGTCPKCGDWSSGRYCPMDGARLGQDNCQDCGWQMLSHHAYCGGCGAKR